MEFCPELDVVVRANTDRDIELLYQLGAKEVVQPEFEASLELSAHLLDGMGLTGLQIQTQLQAIRRGRYLKFRPERSAYAVAQELRLATQEMNSKWYSLPAESPVIGMTVADTDLRRLTGVTVMAIQRQGGEELDYPDATAQLELGDRLLVIGQAEEIEAFKELVQGKIAIPLLDASCQWLVIPAQSSTSGTTLAALDIGRRYRVQIQALRRGGQFIRFPSGDTILQEGDRLLLCGAAGDIPAVATIIQATLPTVALRSEA